MSDKKRSILVLAAVTLAYFASYPEDAQAITTPINTFLNLTTEISPWFYGVVAVGIVATSIVKTWGCRTGS